MRLFELFEAKTEKTKVKSPPPRNWVAKNAKTTGAGPHNPTKHTRTEKHKNKIKDEYAIYDKLKDYFGRDGIQAVIIENVIEEIEN